MIIKDKNITTIFIVPTLGIDKKCLKEHGFKSGYLDDMKHELDYKDVVYCLFNPENVKKFSLFLDKLYEENNLILEDYNLSDNEIVLIFKFNEKYKEDYSLILSGKYSKTSKKYQDLFPGTVKVGGEDKISLQHMIFQKNAQLAKYWAEFLNDDDIIQKNLELWPSPNIKNEILNYEE